MKIKKILLVCLLLSLTALGIWMVRHMNPPILQKIITTENLDDITIAEPLWGSQGLVVVFVDTKKYPAGNLGQRLGATGLYRSHCRYLAGF